MIELEASLNITEDLNAELLRNIDLDGEIDDIFPLGVTSWNGQTGDVEYEAPVTSVNGQTGDVTIPTPSLNKQTAKVIGNSSTLKASLIGGSANVVTGLSTASVPNVTDAGSASTWQFSVSNGKLTISGANGTAPTLGTDITVATGSSGTATAITTSTLVKVEWNAKDEKTVLTSDTSIQ